MEGFTFALAGVGLAAAIVALTVAFARSMRVLARSHADALTDTLTGLGNRRRLLEDLDDLLAPGAAAPARRLVVLDLDGFKTYNDSYGHPAGDALLARLGETLEGAASSAGGAAYRLGGDEFCALVENDAGGRRALGAAVTDALLMDGERLSASYGQVILPLEADSSSRALQLADRRLYADKSQRRRHAQARQVREALDEALGSRDVAAGLAGVAELAGRVGRALGLRGEELELVVRAAELHDVGKAAVPDAILENPHELDDLERGLLRHHTVVGERILSSARPLGPVAKIVRAGDERFDGAGHPDGLRGDEIPLGARIVAACQAFHDLTSPSPLGHGLSSDEALAELWTEAGGRFDPAVLEVLPGLGAERPATAGQRPAVAGEAR